MSTTIEMKFSQYWRNPPLTFCLASIIDSRLKLVDVESLPETINNMNNTIVNNIFIIKSYFDEPLIEYSTQLGKPETTYTAPQPQAGKKKAS